MNYFRIFMILMCIIGFFTLTHAQESLSVNVASFKNLQDDRGNYTELYYMISRDQIQFTEKETAFIAPYNISLTILDENGENIYDTKDKSGIQTISKNQTELTQNIFDIMKFYLQPGKYTYQLTLSGDGLVEEMNREGNFNIPEYSDTKLQLSQVELCSNISTELTFKKFIKNNMLVYPNPSGIFDIKKPIVFFYAEIYNLEYSVDEPDSEYESSYIIIDAQNDTIKMYPKKLKKKVGQTSVIASYLNVRKLHTGKYHLVIEVKDMATSQVTKRTKMFFVEDVATITKKDADLFRKIIIYSATPTELEIYDKLNLIGKQSFMQKFWKDRDPIPETSENEFKQVYLQRWNYVNTRYVNESLNEEGWQTDRGRIYLLHGSPSDIERNMGEPDLKDYEIWLYETGQYGRKKFVFADLYMRGKYYLIHSETPRQKEIYDPNWKNSVKIR